MFLIGGPALAASLAENGLVAVQDPGADVQSVVSGHHPDLRWRTLMDGAVLVRRGVPWVASNADMTVPMVGGEAPGHGAQVELVRRFADVDPVVAGKPQRTLFDEAVRRVGGRRPLVIGDRLDTDIEGANAAGLHSLLVMTGVTGLGELLAAPAHQRPTYIAPNLSGLFEVPSLVAEGIAGPGGSEGDWESHARAAWQQMESTGGPVSTDEGVAAGTVIP